MRYNEHIISDRHGNSIIKTFRSSVPRGPRDFREHHHTECELSVIVSGAGTYCSGEKRYDFLHGDMFLFGSNEAHCITNISEDLTVLNIHFEPRLLWESPENIDLLKIFAAREKDRVNLISREDAELCSMIMNIEREISDTDAGYAIAVKYELFRALVHILRTYVNTPADSVIPQNSATLARKLGDAMVYIDKNLEQHLTLDDIAQKACMAPTYFSAVFKKFNGISPWDYIMIKRVERAVEMLKSTNMTKLEIAERCGFSSSSNFYKVFVKITGKQPSDYSSK